MLERFTIKDNRSAFKAGRLIMLLTGLFVIGMLTMPALGQQVTDKEITMAVTERLMNETGVSGYRIDVTTSQGIVTLSGTVNNILAKDRATDVVETIKGVRSVVNNLTIEPTDRPDEAIQSDVTEALATDPATDAWGITSQVNDGKVTLAGFVDSWTEKRLAGRVAKGVRGVTELDNQITVNTDATRSDSEIETEITEALRWDALIDDALIDVGVDDNVVTLSGDVGSAAEKTRAIMKSWVAGVTNVDASALEVSAWARDEEMRTDKYVKKTDSEIEMAIKDAMLYDPRVNSFNVDVTVNDGVVLLSGVVDNLKAKRAASRDARNTVGVWRVQNNILIRTEPPVTDEAITAAVTDALERDPFVSRQEITVNTLDGEVFLTGVVDSYFEKSQADDVASRVEGVVEVHNNLSVVDEFSVLTYDPYIDHDWWSVYDYDWYTLPAHQNTILTDWEIREEIKDEIWWSPYVDTEDVTVTVNNGMATLSGTVDTWNERQAATRNAYEAGAVSVDNNLNIRYGPLYFNP